MKKFIQHRFLPENYTSSSLIKFEKLSEHLGVKVDNIDLSKLLTGNQFDDINEALSVHSLLVFPNQSLTNMDMVKLSELFGSTLPHIVNKFNQDGVIVLSNKRDKNGKLIGADRSGMQWHSDGSFRKLPNRISLLYGVECPPIGADTIFASTYASFDTLGKLEIKELSKLYGIHDYSWYWSEYQKIRPPLTEEEKLRTPQVFYPILRTHPITGWNSLYVSECVTCGIKGMNKIDGRSRIIELSELMSQFEFRYTHKWTKGDLLIWDNASAIHKGTEYDNKYDRLMLRTSTSAEVPFLKDIKLT